MAGFVRATKSKLKILQKCPTILKPLIQAATIDALDHGANKAGKTGKKLKVIDFGITLRD